MKHSYGKVLLIVSYGAAFTIHNRDGAITLLMSNFCKLLITITNFY